MIFGAILAGGTGSRMGVDKPKQFLKIGDKKPIIIHTIEKFMLCAKFDHIYIGIHADWIDYTKDLITKYIGPTNKIILVTGGENRNATIFNIISSIEKKYGASDEHIIVTHDAVRPFVTLRIINENIVTAQKYGACDTVVKAIDTIVESEDAVVINNIPERSHMFQGQTPQSFNINLIKRLYYDLSNDEKAILTDACKICVVRDVQVRLVEGEITNIKITTVDDLKIARAMIEDELYV